MRSPKFLLFGYLQNLKIEDDTVRAFTIILADDVSLPGNV